MDSICIIKNYMSNKIMTRLTNNFENSFLALLNILIKTVKIKINCPNIRDFSRKTIGKNQISQVVLKF